ncbi:MAG TPA: hypothetical protein VL946_08410 [Lacibacter sp.]|nr:hypothetical protein [Lacibacter sp.]
MNKNNYTVPQKKRPKYVAPITKKELYKLWGRGIVPYLWPNTVYVKVTKEGIVNDWENAPIYKPEEIVTGTGEFSLVPLHKTTECIHGCGQQFDVPPKKAITKGETVYTIYNRIPGILKCEVYTCELGKVGVVVKQILTIEKDENAERKLETYLNDLLFTADENNVFRDLEMLFERIILDIE